MFAALLLIPVAAVTLVALVNVLTAPTLDRAPAPRERPRVSVLVPARNEEATLERCLAGLLDQDWPELEVLVLDDHSSDATGAIARRIAERDTRLRVLQGQPLPRGWTGKAWACHQLAGRAGGELLVFTDADNRHAPHALRATVGWMQRHRLEMLSAFPQQIVRSAGEVLVVPTVDLILYSLLPLWLTLYGRHSSLAAANGQWLAFTREGYRRVGGHQAVRGEVVEDVELARRAKRRGLRTLTTAGTGTVYGTMYGSWSEVREGFGKNLLGIGGGRSGMFILFLSSLLWIWAAPVLLLALPSMRRAALGALGMNLVMRSAVAKRFRHPWPQSVLLHPLGTLVTALVGLRSLAARMQGGIRWKGRWVRV